MVCMGCRLLDLHCRSLFRCRVLTCLCYVLCCYPSMDHCFIGIICGWAVPFFPRKKPPQCKCLGCDRGGGRRASSHSGPCVIPAQWNIEFAGYCKMCASAQPRCPRCSHGVVEGSELSTVCPRCVERASVEECLCPGCSSTTPVHTFVRDEGPSCWRRRSENKRDRGFCPACVAAWVFLVFCEDHFLQTSAFFVGVPVMRSFGQMPLQRLCRWTPQRCSSALRSLRWYPSNE